MKTIYLSGPMTGYKNMNFEAFNEKAKILRALGHVVLNPAENFDGNKDLPRSVYLKHDLQMLLRADYIYFLPGWSGSAGAILEAMVARECGIREFGEIHTCQNCS